jgi:hypothetical protein
MADNAKRTGTAIEAHSRGSPAKRSESTHRCMRIGQESLLPLPARSAHSVKINHLIYVILLQTVTGKRNFWKIRSCFGKCAYGGAVKLALQQRYLYTYL